MKLAQQANSLIVASLLAFAVGSACAIAALPGNFDNMVSYCDQKTNPCTSVIVPQWAAKIPARAKLVQQIEGSSSQRLALGITALVCFPIGIIAATLALPLQEKIDREANLKKRQEEITDEFFVYDFWQNLRAGYNEIDKDKL